jgi:hypothetical protein
MHDSSLTLPMSSSLANTANTPTLIPNPYPYPNPYP